MCLALTRRRACTSRGTANLPNSGQAPWQMKVCAPSPSRSGLWALSSGLALNWQHRLRSYCLRRSSCLASLER
eukprot:2989642-Rhodomonas_salina.4